MIFLTIWLTAGLSYWIDKTCRDKSFKVVGLFGAFIGLLMCLVMGPIPILVALFRSD